MSSNITGGLIVNADDLGIHPRIDAGIWSAYEKGILSSATMLMTTPYLAETVKNFVRPGVLPIGIHLCLTMGRAVASANRIQRLVDENGEFKLSAGRLIFSAFSSHDERDLMHQIGVEFEAQLALARDLGLKPTHADSHEHVHMNPALFGLLEKLLPRFGIKRLRYSRERLVTCAAGRDFAQVLKRRNPAKWAILRWRSTQIKPRLAVPDQFFGILYSGVINKRALRWAIMQCSPGGSMEICIHPGFSVPSDDAPYRRRNFNEFIRSEARQAEYDILVDRELVTLIRERGLALRSFDGRCKY